MRLAFSDLCSNIVARFDKSWGYIGWTLWIAWLVTFFLLASSGALWAIWLTLSALLALWWGCDACDQQIAWWQGFAGLIMLGIGFLPRGGILAIACWVLYWFKVRE